MRKSQTVHVVRPPGRSRRVYLSVNEAAEDLGISRNTLSNWSSGRKIPGPGSPYFGFQYDRFSRSELFTMAMDALVELRDNANLGINLTTMPPKISDLPMDATLNLIDMIQIYFEAEELAGSGVQ